MILVKFRKCVQVGPEDWDMVHVERLFDEKSTLQDVKDFIIVNEGFHTELNGSKRMKEVLISEPQKP